MLKFGMKYSMHDVLREHLAKIRDGIVSFLYEEFPNLGIDLLANWWKSKRRHYDIVQCYVTRQTKLASYLVNF